MDKAYFLPFSEIQAFKYLFYSDTHWNFVSRLTLVFQILGIGLGMVRFFGEDAEDELAVLFGIERGRDDNIGSRGQLKPPAHLPEIHENLGSSARPRKATTK